MQQWYNCPRCQQQVQYGQPQCYACGYQIYWQQPTQQSFQTYPQQTTQQSTYQPPAQTSYNPKHSDIYRSQYNRHKKSVFTAYVLWLFLGWHYAYLGKWGWQVLYWLSIAGLFIWAFIDLFRIPNMVSNYNEDLSVEAMLKAKALE